MIGEKANLCGIYTITNLNDGRATAYVGSTTLSFRERWGRHTAALQRGAHSNCRLQRAWNRDGEHSFAFTVLEIVDGPDDVLAREQYWLDAYRETGSIYNFSIVAGSPMRGLKHTAETKQRLCITSSKHRHTESAKQKIAQTHEKPYPSFLNVNTGKVIPAGIGLTRMCREHDLSCSGMSSIKNGSQRSSQGWMLSSNANLIKDVKGDARRDGKYPAFMNVYTGDEISSGVNLADMCRERGLCRWGMHAVKSGAQKSHRGWVLANHPEHADSRKHPAFVNRDTGEVIPAGYNLAKTCREHGLKRSGMYMVANGSNQSNYGWELLNVTGGP